MFLRKISLYLGHIFGLVVGWRAFVPFTGRLDELFVVHGPRCRCGSGDYCVRFLPVVEDELD